MKSLLVESDLTLYYLVALMISFLISVLMTPLSKKLAFKIGAIDQPKARGMHKKAMPLAGGTAIVTGFVLTVVLMSPLIEHFKWSQVWALIVGGLFISVVGLFDDIYNLKAKLKLIFQIAAAILIVYSGIEIRYVSWPFSPTGVIDIGFWGKVVTVVWIVGVTNAVNLIDGLDGLAAGVSSIASICLMILSIASNQGIAVVLTAALAGACLGFLPHNFNPATIFMGDTGSTFLGFTLAVISIQGTIKSYTIFTIVVIVLVLGLPIFDTAFAIARRAIQGKPIMEADRGHLHHRLVDWGYSHKRAVLTLYGVSGCFGIAGILFAAKDTVPCILILTALALYIVAGSIKYKNANKSN